MKQYFKDFEDKLRLAEEKLDILSEWHIAKGHKGATEIAEGCRIAISQLWLEFYRLSEQYKKAEASHEEILQKNIDNLLGELKKIDDESVEEYEAAPEWLLFSYLKKAVRNHEANEGVEHYPTALWFYLRWLVTRDLQERKLL